MSYFVYLLSDCKPKGQTGSMLGVSVNPLISLYNFRKYKRVVCCVGELKWQRAHECASYVVLKTKGLCNRIEAMEKWAKEEGVAFYIDVLPTLYYFDTKQDELVVRRGEDGQIVYYQ